MYIPYFSLLLPPRFICLSHSVYPSLSPSICLPFSPSLPPLSETSLIVINNIIDSDIYSNYVINNSFYWSIKFQIKTLLSHMNAIAYHSTFTNLSSHSTNTILPIFWSPLQTFLRRYISPMDSMVVLGLLFTFVGILITFPAPQKYNNLLRQDLVPEA